MKKKINNNINESRIGRISFLIVCDTILLILSSLLSLIIVQGSIEEFCSSYLYLILFQLISLLATKFYSVRLMDSSIELGIRDIGIVIGTIAGYLIIGRGDFSNFEIIRLFIVNLVFSYSSVLIYRVAYRYFLNFITRSELDNEFKESKRPLTIVYGAGEIGKTLASQSTKGKLPYNIVGFIDDDKVKQNTLILNRKVLGKLDDIENILISSKCSVLIIAITQLSAENMQRAVEAANTVGISVKIVPTLFEINSNIKTPLNLRTVDYSDLLGRKLIEIDRTPIREMIENKVVLITGACGSIGSEISRQAKSYNPKQLLLLDIDESGLHDNVLRLLNYKAEWSEEVMPILCDIKNKEKLNKILVKYKPDIIFHAAAYKHVPMVQLYPEEGIRNNVGGSYNLLSAAKKHGVKKVVVISTDKAVNPTNVMGATKRMVELEAAMLNSPETEIVCVRFGNVIGSRGSMLPLFIEEIQAGVPITVTDKNIIRYFMAIPEAVSLVFLAGSLGKGGEVMVLDMGNPINIYQFAKKLINMYGDPEVNKINIIGLRPGEKMYEELLANKDNTMPTKNKLIFKAKLSNTTLDKKKFLETLSKINIMEPDELKSWVKDTVPEFVEK
jgi:FlaA1/EpsC-like NDP-sugar epimerase